MSLVPDNQKMTTRVNMNPAVFLPGKHEAAITEAKRVFDLANRYRNTSVGTLIPYGADSNIVKEISKFIESYNQ